MNFWSDACKADSNFLLLFIQFTIDVLRNDDKDDDDDANEDEDEDEDGDDSYPAADPTPLRYQNHKHI